MIFLVFLVSLFTSCFAGDDCKNFPLVLAQSAEYLEPSPNLDTLQKSPISLDTTRLTLRTPQLKDMPRIFDIFKDPETVKYTWFVAKEGEPWTINRVTKKYDSFAKDQLGKQRVDFVLETKDSPPTVVGRCALYKREGAGADDWEFGITIHKDYQGKKYAEETMRAMIRYAFNELKAKNLWFETEPENQPMLKQYERLGIRKEKDAADDIPRGPLKHRYHQFLITQEEWSKNWKQ